MCWDNEKTFGPGHFPDYAKTFGDTKILMILKIDSVPILQPLKDAYLKDVRHDFVYVAESPRWILMKRR